jgi:hypothetical protein
MVDVDVSQMKRVLSEIKRREFLWKAFPRRYRLEKQAAFRKGVESRLKAREVLAAIPPPPLIEHVSLNRPFLIWPHRSNGVFNSFFDSHIQPLNNFANIHVTLSFDDTFFVCDDVGFYFIWQNDTGSDAVLNVEALLDLSGWGGVWAKAGWYWTPFWMGTNEGESRMVLTATLTLLEWWNDPSTRPLLQTVKKKGPRICGFSAASYL